jgi:hypothetical protein
VWEDGVSRAHEQGAVDLLRLEVGREAGAERAALRVLRADSGCGIGAHEALLPGGDARLPGSRRPGGRWRSTAERGLAQAQPLGVAG